MKMSKRYAIFITCLFLAFIGVFFAANALTPDRTFSPMENRTLAQAPKLDVGSVSADLQVTGNLFNGQFMEDFEEYVTDQFALRDQWIALKAGAEAALGKQENNGVFLCEKDTLIARLDPPATDRQKNRIEQNFGYITQFADKTDIPVYFSLIPGKVTVWADRLPYGAPNDDEGVYQAKGAATSARWIDLVAPLTAHSDEDIFFRTDHHWSTLGAYYGYEALVKGMGLTPKPLSELTGTTVSTEFLGTTFSTSGVRWVKPDVIELFVPQEAAKVINYFDENPKDGQLYNMDQLQEKDKYSMFLGGNKPKTIIQSNVAPAGAPKLLIIRDSFSDAMAPFLCYNFSEIHLMDLRYYRAFSVSQYIAENDIDMALVLYSIPNFCSADSLLALTR